MSELKPQEIRGIAAQSGCRIMIENGTGHELYCFNSLTEFADNLLSHAARRTQPEATAPAQVDFEVWAESQGYPTVMKDAKYIAHTTRAALNAWQSTQGRFYMDHGVWHDRVTGQHLWTQDQYDAERRAAYALGKSEAAPAQDLSAAILALPLPDAWFRSMKRGGMLSEDGYSLAQVQELLKAAAALASSANALSAAKKEWRGSLTQVICDVPIPEGSYKYQHGFVTAKETILEALRKAGFDALSAGDRVDAVLQQAGDALSAMLSQFTRTPSSLQDSKVRGMAHDALHAIAGIRTQTK